MVTVRDVFGEGGGWSERDLTIDGEIRRLVARSAEWRLPLEVETKTQVELEKKLNANGSNYVREVEMAIGRIDFFAPKIGLGVEVKLKGAAGAMLRQLRGYSMDPRVKALVLLTARAMNSPPALGPRNVPVTVIDITGGWM